MASVRKLNPKDASSPWIVEYTDAAGKRRRKTPKSGLKKDADALRQKIERELNDGDHLSSSESTTVANVVADFLEVQMNKVRDGRIGLCRYQNLECVFRRTILPHIGRLRIVDVTAKHLEDMYGAMVQGGLKPRTARARLQAFALVQKHAMKRGFTKKDVSSVVLRDLRGMPAAKVRTFTETEMQKLLTTANTRSSGQSDHGFRQTQCYVNLAAFCGLRFGEICALRVQDIDLDKRTIRVRQNLTRNGELKGPKTKAGVRDVPIPHHVVTMLAAYLSAHYRENKAHLVFTPGPSKNSNKPKDFVTLRNFWKHKWVPVIKRAGLLEGELFHFHALRHFCASWWIHSGLPVAVAARLLGHEKFDTTLQIYTHVVSDEDEHRAAVDRMAQSLVSYRRDENATLSATSLISLQ